MAGRPFGRFPRDITNKAQEHPVKNIEKTDAHKENPISFFKTIYDLFYRAEKESGGGSERILRIGGCPVRLRFAGKDLARLLLPAFEHLSENENITPALTILLGQDSSYGVSMPSVPFESRHKVVRGSLWQFKNGGQDIVAQLSDEIYNILDRGRDLAVCWFRKQGPIPQNEIGSPLLKIFHWWMGDHGRQLVHAGAVGTREAGILLVGKGGSGKSTAALSCLNSGLYYAADDYCLVSHEPQPYAYSLYCTGKVKESDTWRFPFLKEAMSDLEKAESGKVLYYIPLCFPDKVIRGFPIRALLLPQVKGEGKTKIRSLSPASCLLMLGPSTVSQLPVAQDRTLKNISELVKRVPGFVLEMGADISGIPWVIQELINRERWR
jgi:hypothetical protein